MSFEGRQITYFFSLSQRKTEHAWQGAELNLPTCVVVVCSMSRDLHSEFKSLSHPLQDFRDVASIHEMLVIG